MRLQNTFEYVAVQMTNFVECQVDVAQFKQILEGSSLDVGDVIAHEVDAFDVLLGGECIFFYRS